MQIRFDDSLPAIAAGRPRPHLKVHCYSPGVAAPSNSRQPVILPMCHTKHFLAPMAFDLAWLCLGSKPLCLVCLLMRLPQLLIVLQMPMGVLLQLPLLL